MIGRMCSLCTGSERPAVPGRERMACFVPSGEPARTFRGRYITVSRRKS
ncbi:hypothetical protein FHS01_003015 [Longimicrobium terrae]|uniref:Uncharacterized protein n=1 Tax=Longimicrobium terrae TaxID=1639882 RepID=A0A841H0A2_9BACT|nr:hypothetical protein [Longimicrobium terrae]MBB6071398.1 hypothetical protein [Longimicrobium terrae]